MTSDKQETITEKEEEFLTLIMDAPERVSETETPPTSDYDTSNTSDTAARGTVLHDDDALLSDVRDGKWLDALLPVWAETGILWRSGDKRQPHVFMPDKIEIGDPT